MSVDVNTIQLINPFILFFRQIFVVCVCVFACMHDKFSHAESHSIHCIVQPEKLYTTRHSVMNERTIWISNKSIKVWYHNAKHKSPKRWNNVNRNREKHWQEFANDWKFDK